MILLDTNVLIYATDTRSEHHEPSRRVVDAVIEGRLQGAILPQVLVEFIGAVTGPSVEIPLDPLEAVAQASIFRAQIRTLHPPESSFDELTEIIRATGRGGRRIFDYFLSAQAKALGISSICTYNVDDFEGIPGILVSTPAQIDIPAPPDF